MNPLAQIPALNQWQTFYEIIGSAGGALVGLQFVVIALIASSRTRADFAAINAFGTPNVVHFGAALTVAALMSAAWPSLKDVSIAMGMCGILGLAYSANVFRRTHHQTVYKPVIEDWLFYAILPCVIYATLTAAAVLLHLNKTLGLFTVAAAALGLLLIGIRNAWDTVTHIVAQDAVANHDDNAAKLK